MSSYNRVVLMGNLTRDPEVRHLASGTAVAELGMAVNEKYKTKDGETKDATMFVDVVVWGRQAETTGEYLTKGSPVLIEGKLQLDQWENKEGEKRSKIKVRADRIVFMGSRSDADDNGGHRPGREQKPPGVPDRPLPQDDDENLPF